MRIGSRSPDAFMSELGEVSTKIQAKFVESIKGHIRPETVKVMLGDATVTEQKTFDPGAVLDYFSHVVNSLGSGWEVQGPTVTNNDDIRRIFAKFSTRVGRYLLSGHVSVQFHVLLYYKADHKVIDVQKELASLIDSTKESESALADRSDRLVLEKLSESGHADLDSQRLFEVLFEDDRLRENIYAEVNRSAGTDLQAMAKRKQDLFDELDGLLVETYQTSPVMIDDARLVTGEEGYLCTFDLEFVQNGSREGVFDPRKMSDVTRGRIREELAGFERII